eukprot:392132_1
MYIYKLVLFIGFIALFCGSNGVPCSDAYNYAFVVDESGSVGVLNYQKSIDFVKNIVSNHVNSVSNIAALAFSSAVDFIYGFNEDQTSRNALLSELEQEKTDFANSLTYTDDAMRAAILEFKNNGFNDKNILILVTDGVPYPPEHDPCQTDILNDLQTYNIRVAIVGVTGGFSSTEVKCLVSDVNDIITIPSFDDFGLVITQLEATQVLCPEYDCIASVEDCVGRDDRNYHSCTSCNVFASCWGGSTQFTDNRPCPPVHPWQEPLEYDFNLDACVWAGESTTCNGYEQEHSFFVGPSLLNWADGQTYCESQGGNLASVHSFTELVEVRDLCIGTGQTSCHIGMFMDANSGKWLWTDGSNSDYGFNSNGSPDGNIRPPWEAGYAYDGAGEKCQKMDLQLGGYFDDGYCSSNRPVICYGNAPAAKSFYNSIDFGDNFNDIDGINVKHNYYYGYIMLIGVIAFILINNIFIGCWCMGK